MCIFASPVVAVKNTAIFAGRFKDRQCVVYEMAATLRKTGKGNAMILPVPARAADIELIDLSAVPEFFAPFRDLFVVRARSMGTKGAVRASLKVLRVGNYDVSVVPKAKDVTKLNPDVFEVSPEAARALAAYPPSFSFVVAQLRTSGAFHPLAYTHPADGALFVPTKHEHGGSSAGAQWDHHIFYQEGTPPILKEGHNSAFIERVDAQGAARSMVDVATHIRAHGASRPLAPYVNHLQGVSRLRAEGPLHNTDIYLE